MDKPTPKTISLLHNAPSAYMSPHFQTFFREPSIPNPHYEHQFFSQFLPPFQQQTPFSPPFKTSQTFSESQNKSEEWQITFLRKSDKKKFNMKFNSKKPFEQVINDYKVKSGDDMELKFSILGKLLDPNSYHLPLDQLGIKNNSTIVVEKKGITLNFVDEKENQSISINISKNQKFSEAIDIFKNKIIIPYELSFYLNDAKEKLNPDLKISDLSLEKDSTIKVKYNIR